MLLFYSLIFTLPIPHHPLLAYHLGHFTILKYLGMACLLMAIVRAVQTRTCPAFSKGSFWFIVYFLVAFISCLVHDGTAAFSSDPFMYTVSTFSLFFITATMVRTVEHVRWAVLVALGSVAWGSLYVIAQWIHFHNIYPDFRTFGGLADDPNYYAVTVVLWMPLMVFWLMTDRPRWEKWFCLACISVMVVGFIFAASRGGFLGLSVALTFLIWHTRRRARIFALASLLMLPILLAPGQSAVTRLFHPDYGDQESTQYRLELWQASQRSFSKHPLFGIGLGHFHPSIEQNGQIVRLPFHVAHNTYIGLVTDLGLAGFLPFILVLLGAQRRLRSVALRAFGASNPDQRLLRQIALGLQAGLIGYMVCALFLSTLWQQVFWFSVFLSMCLPRIGASLPVKLSTRSLGRQSKSVQVPRKTPRPSKVLRPTALCR
jgi:O-antigen ligase